MDIARFDAVTRAMARPLRRRSLAGQTAGLAAALTTLAGAAPADAAKRRRCTGKKRTRCQGKCVDVKTNRKHCGQCNRACLRGYPCRNGRCEFVPCGGDHRCLVFISSASFPGNIGAETGLAGADAACTALANSAGYPGLFMAWLSDSTTGPATRFPTQSPDPYVLPNGTVVAFGWADLTSGTLAHGIDRTELDEVATFSVWTNTKVDGFPARTQAADSCGGWTDNTDETSGVLGLPSATSGQWTNAGTASCDLSLRLYCVQQATVL